MTTMHLSVPGLLCGQAHAKYGLLLVTNLTMLLLFMQAVSPGPGEYTLPATTLKQGPAFTMGARPAGQHGGSKAANMPGPGACTAR